MNRAEFDLDQLLRIAGEYQGYKINIVDLRRFLALLLDEQPIDLWDYTRKSDLYIRTILSLLYALEREKFLYIDGAGMMSLAQRGGSLADFLGIRKTAKPFIEKKQWFGWELTPEYKEILEIIKELYKRVNPQYQYDQAPLVPEAAVYKVAYGIEKGDFTGKDVVCIGDDDLTSVILALSGVPGNVLALDIDKYLLETIEEYSEKNRLRIDTREHDLCKPVPENLKGRFDVFITEPPDTVTGISLFVSRGVELLKESPGMIGYCGISLTACPPQGLLEIQKNLTNMGLLITDRIPKYSDYPPHRTELKHVEVPDCYDDFYPPEKVWYVSDLVRVKTAIGAKRMFETFDGDIADYNSDAERFA